MGRGMSQSRCRPVPWLCQVRTAKSALPVAVGIGVFQVGQHLGMGFDATSEVFCRSRHVGPRGDEDQGYLFELLLIASQG